MRFLLVLVITISVLLALGVACGGDEKEAPVIPSPASESDGDAEEWEEDEGEPPPLHAIDSDDDGFDDVVEEDHGSDPLDDTSVPESEDANPGSCGDDVDNDLDGDTDDADDGCFLVSATLDVTPRDYVGPCPVSLTFSGTITLEAGSGTVSYQFIRSDGGATDTETLTFDSPGTQDVSTTFNRGYRAMGASISDWVVIRILEPEELESNRANYTVDCREEEPDEDCMDSDMDTVCDDDDDDDDNDGFSDADENDYGSDPFDDASVPETDEINLGSCVDSEDNDGDGLLDGADPGCA